MKKKANFISKRTLYIVCFTMLTIIEMIRGTSFVEMEIPTGTIRLTEVLGGLKAGDLWYIASNLTGLVMMVVVFSAYKIKAFVTISNVIWTSMCLGVMIWLPYYRMQQGATFHLLQVETAILNIWWLFIIIKYMLMKAIANRKVVVKWNLPAIVWGLMSVCMLLSVYEDKWWVLWYFLFFGVFFLTEYTSKDREDIWNGMIDGLLISFVIVQGAAFLLRPFDSVRYSGLHANANSAGLYYLIVYVVCLCKMHLLHIVKSNKKEKICILFLAGCALVLQFMTMCRTAWIVSIIATVLYGIAVMRKKWKSTWKKIALSGALIVFSMFITFVPIFMAARWGPTVLPIRVWYDGEWGDETKIYYGETPFSDKYTELNEFLETAFGRITSTLQFAKNYSPFVLKAYAAQVGEANTQVELIEPEWVQDLALRMRLTIYKAYWDDLTWIGNDNTRGYYQIEDMGGYHSWHAQNVWLQIAYYYGIPAGVLFVCLTVLLFIYNYKKMFSYKENPYSIIPFFMCVVYFGFGTMEVVWSLGQIALFLVFFVHMPLEEIK